MDQRPLYQLITEAGFKVIAFEDMPVSQGSWRITFSQNGKYYSIACDRFERSISLPGIGKKSVSKTYKTKTQSVEEELNLIRDWLQRINNF